MRCKSAEPPTRLPKKSGLPPWYVGPAAQAHRSPFSVMVFAPATSHALRSGSVNVSISSWVNMLMVESTWVPCGVSPGHWHPPQTLGSPMKAYLMSVVLVVPWVCHAQKDPAAQNLLPSELVSPTKLSVTTK